ncbi:hypothetical protein GF386_02790 [Candidatus Pacearchaeota archaeon]|nr:hypothetical protein [Candidatus Pacearchaeota archaeon]MBD3283075.1 hypothetical protein [Candidatus Pacearchaeota archaeon]
MEGYESDDEPVYVGGGSDSRANWAYPGDPDYPGGCKDSSIGQPRENTGCLVALVGGLSFVGSGSCLLYGAFRYLFT